MRVRYRRRPEETVARRRRIRDLTRALYEAPSYEAWMSSAEALDQATGMDAWRADDRSRHYDARRIRADLSRFEALRAAGDHRNLGLALHDSVHRHMADLSNPILFHTAWSGTKHLVTRWLDAVCDAIDVLAAAPLEGELAELRLATFEREAFALGRTALMLSGGATLGFIHLGVVKALFEHDLLPPVLTGASMGAMVAAGVGTRNDDELRAMFEDPEQIELRGLAFAGVGRAVSSGALLDPDVLLDTIRHNNGHDLTFAEAEAHSGRTLVVSVAPTRRNQPPRVLDPVPSPDVLVAEAARASAALPFVFPPAELMRRTRRGGRRPYLAAERWIDGSAGNYLPKRGISRLHGVDHFIVSQTNPHVIPFLSDPRQRDPLRKGLSFLGKATLRQISLGLDLAHQLTANTPVRPFTEIAAGVAAQEYTGDISVHPSFRVRWVPRTFTNPTRAQLAEYIREGERATWPHLARIHAETRVARHLDRALARLRASDP